jgi:chromosome segregation ATPase
MSTWLMLKDDRAGEMLTGKKPAQQEARMRRASILWFAGAGLLTIVTFRTSVSSQTVAPNQDTLAALLVEVRGLRAAMEQMASAGPRVQLAFGRLQMQEQRVNTLARRAEELRTRIGDMQAAINASRDRQAAMQRDLERNPNPDVRNELENALPVMKRELAQRNAELQRLQMEEADVSSQLTTEQSRWIDINQRLEELDRALRR